MTDIINLKGNYEHTIEISPWLQTIKPVSIVGPELLPDLVKNIQS